MNENMAPKLSSLPCFEAFWVIFCPKWCSYFVPCRGHWRRSEYLADMMEQNWLSLGGWGSKFSAKEVPPTLSQSSKNGGTMMDPMRPQKRHKPMPVLRASLG